MALFTRLYDMALRWARHRHAPRYLAGLSFAESSFFPIPPDVMLMPMSLARPERAIRFATLTTVASVLGVKKEAVIGRFFHMRPARFEVAAGDPRCDFVVADIDDESGKTVELKHLQMKVEG